MGIWARSERSLTLWARAIKGSPPMHHYGALA